MRKLIIILIVLGLVTSAFATESKKGTAGAQFLKIGVGSRYQAMGEASVATASDIYSMYWNPAGLVDVENNAVGFTRVNYVLDIDLNYAAIAKNFEDVGVFGASVMVLSMGEQEVTSADVANEFTGERFDAGSYAVGLSFARDLTTRFSFGVTAKFIGEKIYEETAEGYAFDFGTILRTGFKSLRLGMAISNMGPEMQFSGPEVSFDGNAQTGNDPFTAQLKTTPFDLPLAFRVGLAYDIQSGPKAITTISMEMKHPNDNDQQGAIGAEFGYDEKYFLRGGYKINYEEETLAFGGGLVTPLGEDVNLQIDYSWQDFGRLNTTQRFSIGFTF